MDVSIFNQIEMAPSDPIFGPQNAYLNDPSPKKVNLVVGAYRTDEGKPWVLPVVRKAEELLLSKPTDHEYLPIDGLKEFTDGAARLMFGVNSLALKEKRIVSVQNLSGSGSLRLGADFLCKYFPDRCIYIPDPTWANHRNVFSDARLSVKTYRYFDLKTNGLDFDGMISDLRAAPNGAFVLFHACAHNPTGVDPSNEQWQTIIDLVKEKSLLPFFDSAYQGFATGDLDGDAYAVRLFESQGLEFLIAQSFAKNMGLYGERTGCLHIVVKNIAVAERIRSQLKRLIRGAISNPPTFGARIAAIILNDPERFQQWVDEVKIMANRIKTMREALYNHLMELKTPGSWTHIVKQIGMFSYTGLTEAQCDMLMSRHHIYLTKNGRISIAGLNTSNVSYVAQAIHDVVSSSN